MGVDVRSAEHTPEPLTTNAVHVHQQLRKLLSAISHYRERIVRLYLSDKQWIRRTVDSLILPLIIDIVEVPQHFDRRQMRTRIIHNAFAPVFDNVFQ